MLIDIHHHYIPEQLINLVRQQSEHYQGVVYRDTATGLDALVLGVTSPPAAVVGVRSPFAMEPRIFDLSLRLQDMTEMQLDMAALSVSPVLFNYSAPAVLGKETSEICNDAIYQAVRKHPRQFIGMGTIPMQDTRLAIDELERIVSEYGFPAIEIGGSVNGFNLDEPRFDPIFRRASELDVLVFVHPIAVPAAERLSRYYSNNLIGLPVETGICVASLIFGGVLERYPGIKVCLAHGGGIAPSLIGRWDHGWNVRAEAKVAISRPPSVYLRQLYFDNLVHSTSVLRALLGIVGPSQIIVGTDYPYDMGQRHPMDVLDALEAPKEVLQRIGSITASRLLKVRSVDSSGIVG
ncbi:MAG: amidohydrolase family protein [Dehalococcoidia bacterium]|nr:amidohydrolase family protein [Dehalococcoidia bacterium]